MGKSIIENEKDKSKGFEVGDVYYVFGVVRMLVWLRVVSEGEMMGDEVREEKKRMGRRKLDYINFLS